MQRHVLVTGATGFLGAHVCRRLAEHGHAVVALLHSNRVALPDLASVLTDRIVWDMAGSQKPIIPPQVDTIVHLAQSHRYREFPNGAQDMFDVNVHGTFDLLEAARRSGIVRFVYASSGGIYGQSRNHLFENQPVVADSNIGFYLTTKLIGELLINNYATFFSAAVLRVFFAYGPGQQPDRLLPRLVANVAAGRPVTLAGHEGLTINPIYVSDATDAIVRAVELDKIVTLNVAGLEPISLRKLCALIGEIVGRAPVFEIAPEGDNSMLVGDVSLMCDTLNVHPRVSLREGLAQMVKRQFINSD
jgi:UDP-glucose 4-epimerase